VIDPAALQMVLCVLTGWLDRREREAVAYLIEENRLPAAPAWDPATASHRRRSPPAGGTGVPGGPFGPAGDRHDRDAGHVAALASAADCAEMDVRQPAGAARHPPGDSTACRADGGGESDVGLL
jgi:hypothetical protein